MDETKPTGNTGNRAGRYKSGHTYFNRKDGKAKNRDDIYAKGY